MRKPVSAVILSSVLACAVCAALAASSAGFASVSAATDVPLKEKYQGPSGGGEEFEYNQTVKYKYYRDVYAGYKLAGYEAADADPIAIPIREAVMVSASSESGAADGFLRFDGRDAYRWTSATEAVEWKFTVGKPGLYSMELDYYMPEEFDSDSSRMLYVDGEIPFFEANNILFRPLWTEIGKPRVNSLGDDVWPAQKTVQRWIPYAVSDANALYTRAFEYYFAAGEHTIRLKYVNNGMAVGECRILPLRPVPDYGEVRDGYAAEGWQDSTQSAGILQAEDNMTEKNSSTIRREYNADPLTLPQSLTNRRLNVIGGWRWRSGAQSVTWSFTVPETGLYKLAFREINVWNDGLPSYREVRIDGEVPFSELLAYRFPYDPDWQNEVLSSDEGEPYLFYFEAGKTHTITMTVTLAPFTDIIYSLNDDTILLSKVLRDIGKIVGSDPDPNYDYELDKCIPTLLGDLQTLMDSMQAKYYQVSNMAAKTPAMANNFLTIKAQMKSMQEDTYTIPRRLSDLTNAMTSLSNWYRELQNQPLMVDSFQAAAPDTEVSRAVSTVFQRLWSTVVNFFISFQKDYDNIGSILDGDSGYDEVLKVWVAYGTEWAELIKQMADTDFTPSSRILVNMNVLPANQLNAGGVNTLMLSITSGKAPDVALGSSSISPVEFAIRDATYDLSKFPDFAEVKKRFLENIFVPYEYDNGTNVGVYALPETMNFNVMFYRKDIISELGIKLPQTRQELYKDVLPVLYQNNLQFFFPVDFSQFIYQHGADYYTKDGKRSALDTPEAYQAFKECTEVFMNYGVPVTADFFNRMRSGEMPMGISNFRLYMLFTAAAPELVGRWGIAPIPGTLKPDGTIDRSAGGLAGECAIIMNQTVKPQAAWEFLKWWTSDEAQSDFGSEIESLVGMDARWNTANLNAFNSLPWGEGDLQVIHEYWKWAKEPPVVLGSYFTGRHLNNAWNRVIVNGEPIRDALEEAVYDINRELKMKREEYGFYD